MKDVLHEHRTGEISFRSPMHQPLGQPINAKQYIHSMLTSQRYRSVSVNVRAKGLSVVINCLHCEYKQPASILLTLSALLSIVRIDHIF